MEQTRNKIEIVGRLGQHVDLRTMPNGHKVAAFSVATRDSYKNKKTQKIVELPTEWHRVVVYGDGLAQACADHLASGSRVSIVGRMIYRKYNDKDGRLCIAAEIVVNSFAHEIMFLDDKARRELQRLYDLGAITLPPPPGDDMDIDFRDAAENFMEGHQ